MNSYDKMLQKTVAQSVWVLVLPEEASNRTEGGILLGKPIVSPFSRVLSVGPDLPNGVKSEVCKVGDRIIFREGIVLNKRDTERAAQGNYQFVHKTNVLGVYDENGEPVTIHQNGSQSAEASP